MQMRVRFAVLAFGLVALAACGNEEPDVCAGVDCGAGTCAASAGVAACSCPEGYVPAALSCQRDVRSGDDHGDTPAASTPLERGAQAEAAFDLATDVDVYSFSVSAGRIYRFSCSWLGSTGYTTDCTVTLREASGRVEREVTVDSTLGYSVGFLATQDAVLFAELRPRSGAGQYRYALLDLGPDDFADALVSAAPVAPGATVSGTFELSGDVDAFALQASAGGAYRLQCQGVGTNCRMRLRDPAGVELQRTSGSFEQLGSIIDLEAGQAGRYTVEVYSDVMLFSPGYGTYSYAVVERPAPGS